MKFISHFIQSAGSLLLALALALWLGNLAGTGCLHPHDPLFTISLPILFWLVGGLSLVAAWFCFFGHKPIFQLAVILWFAINLAIYQIAILWQHTGGFRAYLQDIAIAFQFSSVLVNVVLQGLTLYLLTGSAVCLLLQRFSQYPRTKTADARFQKMSCPACGGHIQFATQNLGQQMPCPHCRKELILRKPENLKMSCFFCSGHIEFPNHAIGEKMPCPHCHKDITLKETA